MDWLGGESLFSELWAKGKQFAGLIRKEERVSVPV